MHRGELQLILADVHDICGCPGDICAKQRSRSDAESDNLPNLQDKSLKKDSWQPTTTATSLLKAQREWRTCIAFLQVSLDDSNDLPADPI